MNRTYFVMVLMFLVVLFGYLTYQILRPFLYPLSWAIVLSVMFYPLHSFIHKHTGRRSLSALITLMIILLVIIGPVFYLSSLLVKEVASVSFLLETGRVDVLSKALDHPVSRKVFAEIAALINISQDHLIGTITNYAAAMGRELLSRVARGIGSIIMTALGFVVMALTLFFLLRDARIFLKKVRDYLPFSEEQKDNLVKRVNDIVFSTIYGGVVVALAQGTAGGAAFALLGIATPVVWGFVIAIISFLPVIGPGIIWIPAAVYFFMNGMVIKGLLLVAAGIGIAAIDTFLRPLIVGNRTQMPFLIIFFSVIGGIQFFGFIGFILGPLVLALFVAFLDVFGSINGARPDGAEGA